MPKFVDMPHPFRRLRNFYITEFLMVILGWSGKPLLPTEHDERMWQAHQPMKLLLHFKNATELEIPDFEKFLEWFFPAIRQLAPRKSCTRCVLIVPSEGFKRQAITLIKQIMVPRVRDYFFSHLCARGEWFRPKKELLDFITKEIKMTEKSI